LRALGIDHLIDYRTEDFEALARQIARGRGVDLILDAIGGDSLKKGYRLLAPTGRLGMFWGFVGCHQRDVRHVVPAREHAQLNASQLLESSHDVA
jgi:NADPH:quinone reductase-like Zn-dependent oxidoreductase